MKTITRSQAIADLRSKLLGLTDDEHSICEVAARMGIFCGGFAQWTFRELKQRHPTIVRSRPHVTRKELEELANRWQLARAYVKDEGLACDVQQGEEQGRHTCQGWNEFDERELAEYYRQLCHEEVEVAPDPDEPAPS